MFAPGGSGKTFVFNMIANYLCQNQYKISCAAWTGIAATLLTEGCTVHCCTSSILWQHFQQIKLTQKMQTNQEKHEFSKWLLDLGNGTLIASPMRDIIEISYV